MHLLWDNLLHLLGCSFCCIYLRQPTTPLGLFILLFSLWWWWWFWGGGGAGEGGCRWCRCCRWCCVEYVRDGDDVKFKYEHYELDVPIKVDFFHRFFYVYQRVTSSTLRTCWTWSTRHVFHTGFGIQINRFFQRSKKKGVRNVIPRPVKSQIKTEQFKYDPPIN